MHNRIKQILDYSGLNQQDFAERISIAPATLSNILKGRVAKYSTDLAVSITQVFPEINPMWLIFGNGEMFNPQAMPDNTQKCEDFGDNTVEDATNPSAAMNGDGTLFDNLSNDGFSTDTRIEYNSSTPTNGTENPVARPAATGNPVVGGRSMGAYPSGRNGAAGAVPSNASSRNVRAANADGYGQRMSHYDPAFSGHNPALYGMNCMDKPARKIKEIRVYFDDDTFEVFSPYKS